MLPIEPDARQHTTAAMALIIIAALTVGMVAVHWVGTRSGPLLLPAAVAYIVFNLGYVFAVVKARLQTPGARFGIGAVLLNILAMALSSVTFVWTALSLCAVAAALAASFLLSTHCGRWQLLRQRCRCGEQCHQSEWNFVQFGRLRVDKLSLRSWDE